MIMHNDLHTHLYTHTHKHTHLTSMLPHRQHYSSLWCHLMSVMWHLWVICMLMVYYFWMCYQFCNHDYDVCPFNMEHEHASLYVREAKQSAQKKRSHRSPLVSIVERENAEGREGFESDASECTTSSPNGTTDNIEVHTVTLKLMYVKYWLIY